MRHFRLLNGEGLMAGIARDTADGHADAFGAEVMAGTFHLDDDPTIAISRICLCSRGADECWHCGRGSKP